MADPLYYAKDGEVRKRSVETKKDENSSSFSLDFPICTVNETVGNEAAQVIADALNGSEELLAALQTELDFWDQSAAECDGADYPEGAERSETHAKAIRTAIAIASATPETEGVEG
ncbi:hypothetical protein LCGC14_3157420 [marine sediment metagenome]|uniref:Uncharacterized protein n=1 Tax=marine sediment metagenome TaxID=412755 RepID=A0A0F8XZ15_9ZZZZ